MLIIKIRGLERKPHMIYGFEEGICFESDPDKCLSFKVIELNLNEFKDSHHLKCYLEEKVDVERGLIPTQSSEDCDLRG